MSGDGAPGIVVRQTACTSSRTRRIGKIELLLERMNLLLTASARCIVTEILCDLIVLNAGTRLHPVRGELAKCVAFGGTDVATCGGGDAELADNTVAASASEGVTGLLNRSLRCGERVRRGNVGGCVVNRLR